MRHRPRSRGLQQNSSTRNLEGGIPPAIGAASRLRFPGEDAGRSLAEMAQRDLDAALQLLADRAQFITGASGAAIALKRSGKSDMLCRASTGSNAPELGALLSTEFGLSGESVRTKRPLRCDDAERDGRVNREVCRHLGIASVVVMPVVHDEEVLGVFELFSGKAHAFGERDLSAVRRLSEMVETAVRMAHLTEKLPEKLENPETAATVGVFEADEEILEVEIPEIPLEPAVAAPIVAGPAETVTAQIVKPADPVLDDPVKDTAHATESVEVAEVEAKAAPAPKIDVGTPVQAAPTASPVAAQTPLTAAAPESHAPRKKLFWSASLDGSESDKASEDQSHVPPQLRGLHKCEACGFPVSAGRVLCVECEEKKWRGQLRKPQPIAAAKPHVSEPMGAKVEAKAFAAAAHASAAPTVINIPTVPPIPPKIVSSGAAPEPKAPAAESVTAAAKAAEEPVKASVQTPELVLSAAMDTPQSWLGSHKYIIAVLIVVALMAAAIFLTH